MKQTTVKQFEFGKNKFEEKKQMYQNMHIQQAVLMFIVQNFRQKNFFNQKNTNLVKQTPKGEVIECEVYEEESHYFISSKHK